MASFLKTIKSANEPTTDSPVVFLIHPSINELALVNAMTYFILENAK